MVYTQGRDNGCVETLPVMKFIQSAGQQHREPRRLETMGEGYMSQMLRLQVTEFFTQAVPGLNSSGNTPMPTRLER